jgi:hypothetical protein
MKAELWATAIARGLAGPSDLVEWGGLAVVVERTGDRVSSVDADGVINPLLIDVAEPKHIARRGDALIIATDAEVIVWEDGEETQLTTLGSPADDLVADDLAAYWVVDGDLYQAEVGSSPEHVADVGGDSQLAITSASVFIANAQPSSDGAALIVYDRASGELTALLTRGELPSGRSIRGVSVGPNDQITVALRLDQWPHSGLICTVALTGQALDCLSDSPPQIAQPLWIGDDLYWSTRRAVVRLHKEEQVTTYKVMSQWHRVAAMTSYQGQLVWVDQLSNTLWRLDD